MNRDLDMRADEFVLGLLPPGEAALLDRTLGDDRDWTAAVARARDRFLPLDDSAPETPLGTGFWPALSARLTDPMPRDVEVEDVPETAGDRLSPANRRGPPRRLRPLPLGLAAAIGLLGGVFLGAPLMSPDPVVIAVLMDDQGVARAVVEDFGRDSARIRFVSDVTVPAGQQMQVWTLPSAETGPMSMGLLRGPQGTSLSPADLPWPRAGQLYEITLEPAGGSPTGRPTGPILAKGLAAGQT